MGNIIKAGNMDSSFQEQIDELQSSVTSLDNTMSSKQNTISGAASTVTGSNLTASRVLISNSSGKIAVNANGVTDTHLSYLNTLTGNVQNQINAKAALASPTFTGTPTAPTAAWGTSSTQLATTAFVDAAIPSGLFSRGTMGFADKTINNTESTLLSSGTSTYNHFKCTTNSSVATLLKNGVYFFHIKLIRTDGGTGINATVKFNVKTPTDTALSDYYTLGTIPCKNVYGSFNATFPLNLSANTQVTVSVVAGSGNVTLSGSAMYIFYLG